LVSDSRAAGPGIAEEVKMTPICPRAAAVLAGGLAGLALAACGGAQPAASAATPAAARSSPAAVATATAGPQAAPVATASVDIASFAFSPAVITVRTGVPVTWTNRDQDAHTVAITGAAVSTPMQGGDTYTHTFSQPGTYWYICTIHPYMHGMVVVTAG